MLTVLSLVGAILVVTIGWIIVAVITTYFSKDGISEAAKKVLFTVILALVGFYATKLFEIDTNLNESKNKIAEIINNQSSSNTFYEAQFSINTLNENSTIRKLLNNEWNAIGEKLNQIKRQELLLKREEIIPKWEDLIKNSREKVWATNVVSLEEWKKFSPTEGEEVHRKAIENGVEIRRIFIYSGKNDSNYVDLLSKAKIQKKWGVKVKLISANWISKSPYVSDLLRDIGSIDVVLYDDECVLLTNVDNNNNMISSILTTNMHRIQRAKELYSKLWDGAETIE